MISCNDFKTGMTVEFENNLYQVMEFQHVKPGKGQAFVRTRLKNLRTGTITEFSFQSDTRMPIANVEKKKMQYLYDDGNFMTFMDLESFIQIEIPSNRLEYEKNFMVEGDQVLVIDNEGEVLGILLPDKVAIEVKETTPGVKGNTAANATKDAVLVTGYHVAVPLFINEGDIIIVNTVEGRYCSRA